MRPAIAAALAVVLLGAPASGQSREFSRTVDLDAGGSLRIEGGKGSMRITSWDQPRVEIRARIVRPDDVDDEYASRAVEATNIAVTGDRKAVAVVSDYSTVPALNGRQGWQDRREPPVHYEVRAPRRINLSVDSDRGPVGVSGFDGTVDIVMDRGELDLSDIGGDVRVEIDRGDRIRIAGVRGSLRLQADRSNVDIDTHGLARDSRIEIDRGEVDLRVPDAQQLTVRADISRRADLNTDFPIQWTSSSRRRGEGLITINGGGAELFVKSDRATIELRRRRN